MQSDSSRSSSIEEEREEWSSEFTVTNRRRCVDVCGNKIETNLVKEKEALNRTAATLSSPPEESKVPPLTFHCDPHCHTGTDDDQQPHSTDPSHWSRWSHSVQTRGSTQSTTSRSPIPTGRHDYCSWDDIGGNQPDQPNIVVKPPLTSFISLSANVQSQLQTLDVEDKDIICLVGKSGVGKTTFASWLAGQDFKLLSEQTTTRNGRQHVRRELETVHHQHDGKRSGSRTITSQKINGGPLKGFMLVDLLDEDDGGLMAGNDIHKELETVMLRQAVLRAARSVRFVHLDKIQAIRNAKGTTYARNGLNSLAHMFADPLSTIHQSVLFAFRLADDQDPQIDQLLGLHEDEGLQVVSQEMGVVEDAINSNTSRRSELSLNNRLALHVLEQLDEHFNHQQAFVNDGNGESATPIKRSRRGFVAIANPTEDDHKRHEIHNLLLDLPGVATPKQVFKDVALPVTFSHEFHAWLKSHANTLNDFLLCPSRLCRSVEGSSLVEERAQQLILVAGTCTTLAHKLAFLDPLIASCLCELRCNLKNACDEIWALPELAVREGSQKKLIEAFNVLKNFAALFVQPLLDNAALPDEYKEIVYPYTLSQAHERCRAELVSTLDNILVRFENTIECVQTLFHTARELEACCVPYSEGTSVELPSEAFRRRISALCGSFGNIPKAGEQAVKKNAVSPACREGIVERAPSTARVSVNKDEEAYEVAVKVSLMVHEFPEHSMESIMNALHLTDRNVRQAKLYLENVEKVPTKSSSGGGGGGGSNRPSTSTGTIHTDKRNATSANSSPSNHDGPSTGVDWQTDDASVPNSRRRALFGNHDRSISSFRQNNNDNDEAKSPSENPPHRSTYHNHNNDGGTMKKMVQKIKPFLPFTVCDSTIIDALNVHKGDVKKAVDALIAAEKAMKDGMKMRTGTLQREFPEHSLTSIVDALQLTDGDLRQARLYLTNVDAGRR